MSDTNAMEANMNFSELINATIREVDVMDLSSEYVVLANVIFENGEEHIVHVEQMKEFLMDHKEEIVSIALVVDVVTLKEDINRIVDDIIQEVFYK